MEKKKAAGTAGTEKRKVAVEKPTMLDGEIAGIRQRKAAEREARTGTEAAEREARTGTEAAARTGSGAENRRRGAARPAGVKVTVTDPDGGRRAPEGAADLPAGKVPKGAADLTARKAPAGAGEPKQEPARLLTLEEAVEWNRQVIGMELRETAGVIPVTFHSEHAPYLRFDGEDRVLMVEVRAEYYGKTWRCWSAMPAGQPVPEWEDAE